jgi:hypothetical protein
VARSRFSMPTTELWLSRMCQPLPPRLCTLM